jgi:hypothetical protein
VSAGGGGAERSGAISAKARCAPVPGGIMPRIAVPGGIICGIMPGPRIAVPGGIIAAGACMPGIGWGKHRAASLLGSDCKHYRGGPLGRTGMVRQDGGGRARREGTARVPIGASPIPREPVIGRMGSIRRLRYYRGRVCCFITGDQNLWAEPCSDPSRPGWYEYFAIYYE